MLTPLPFEPDRRAEAGGDEKIQSGLRERGGHSQLPLRANRRSGTLIHPGCFTNSPRCIHVKFRRLEHNSGRPQTWRQPWSYVFCPAARSPLSPARRCSPPQASPRPPSRSPRHPWNSRSPAQTFSPSGGMAVGTVAGKAGGIADGAGIEAMVGAAAGIAGAGAAVGARDTAMASLRSITAGGARGAAAAESDRRDRESAARRAALALHLLQ